MSAAQDLRIDIRKAGLRNKDRRRNRRVDIKINGRFLDEENNDIDFSTQNISCSGALIQSNDLPPVGSRIVCYFENLGRVSAKVVRHTANRFAISFEATQYKRDKLADKLIWLINRETFHLEEERKEPRYAAGGPALIKRADGRDVQCRVVDISLTGASFLTEGARPLVGEIIKAGNLMGEVVRCEDRLFAIRYLTR